MAALLFALGDLVGHVSERLAGLIYLRAELWN